jgi:PadR family transcriptional regulator AphA
MPRLNKTRFVLLGLLADKPKSGYDLKQEIDEVITHFWRESFGQIYPALHSLCTAELVRKDTERNGKRRRHVYTITAAGRRELKAWLTVPPEVGIIRHELLLKLFFGRHAEPSVLIRHVEEFRARVAASKGFLDQAMAAIRTEVPKGEQEYWLLPVRSGKGIAEAGVAWADDTLTTLNRLNRKRRTET